MNNIFAYHTLKIYFFQKKLVTKHVNPWCHSESTEAAYWFSYNIHTTAESTITLYNTNHLKKKREKTQGKT